MSINRIIQQAASGASGEVLGVGDPWNISTAQWLPEQISFFTVGDAQLNAGFFKPDGTKMYLLAASTDTVKEYDLSTAWDVTSASYLQGFSIAAQEATPTGLFFKPDGTKMYVTGSSGDDVNEYDLSTAWDVTSASYLQNVSVSSTGPQDVFFKPDGTKMYISTGSTEQILEYDLSTAWDVSTASLNQTFQFTGVVAGTDGIFFKSDGTTLFTVDGVYDRLYEYALSTAWDVSTISETQYFNLKVTPADPPSGLFFKPDGSRAFVYGAGVAVQMDLSTAWDVSTASYADPTTRYFDVSGEENAPRAMFFKPDGLKMYVTGSGGDDVNEYDLSTEWNVHTASFNQTFSVSAQETFPEGLFFKPDGTKMYILGNTGNDVNEYDLSTAWDVSTASFVRDRSISGDDATPTGIFFKPDGTKMYITGWDGDDVTEFDLSTAWNISTESTVQTFSVASKEIQPQGIFFKPDGLAMFITGSAGDAVVEYTLSTAWDISSATFNREFSVAGQEAYPTALFFRSDGLKMYITGFTDAIHEYDL